MAGISDAVAQRLLKQLRKEFRVGHLYLSSSYFFAHRNFNGIAKYLRTEYNDEIQHGLSIGDYLNQRDFDMTTRFVDIPASIATDKSLKDEIQSWKKPVHVFTSLLNAENVNYKALNDLATFVQNENDNATYLFVSDMLRNQLKECDEMQETYAKVKSYTAMEGLLWHLDEQLG